MIFIVLARDNPDMLSSRLAHRQRHLDYWTSQPGVVKVAGAMLRGTESEGSAFLIEADDEVAVRALLAADPFTLEKIFSSDIHIQAFRPAIGAWYPA